MHHLILAALAAASTVVAQNGFVLYDQHIPFNQLPYKVDTSDGIRGPQAGFNICNSTTETQDSMCQTMFVNSPDDWCLWAPQQPNSLVQDTEGEMVAWCTKKGHGTRIMPEGTITGMSWIRTTNYIQITGNMDQARINMASNDTGGEMDPHGADLRGNPMGGMVYSTAFSSTGSIDQTSDWTQFTGSNSFCLTVCNPSSPAAESRAFCNNLYDRLGCTYNAPGVYPNGVFEDCAGDLKTPVGIFTGADGKVSTYQQPPESLGAISTVPYTPTIPASSQCTDFTSSVLFAGAPTATITGSLSSSSAASSGSSSTGSLTKSASASVASGTTGSSSTAGASSGNSTKTSGAERVGVKAGVAFVALGVTVMVL